MMKFYPSEEQHSYNLWGRIMGSCHSPVAQCGPIRSTNHQFVHLKKTSQVCEVPHKHHDEVSEVVDEHTQNGLDIRIEPLDLQRKLPLADELRFVATKVEREF